MSQVVKTINGRKYTYDVKWDPQRKKQIWTYQGRIEEKIDQEKLKRELFAAITKHVRVKKEDRKKIMKAIQEVLVINKDCW
jgi:hypothetical protein